MSILNILYEDKYIIVVEKFAGMSSQDDLTNNISLISIIKKYLNEKKEKYDCLNIINRLDKPVGGLIVFTKTFRSNKVLREDIINKNFKKEYLAVTYGKFENKKGIFKDYIIKNSRLNYSKVVDKNIRFSKEAILEYEVLKSVIIEKENLNLVKINLITGRHHQIRVQFSHRNKFLLGDRKYNKKFKYNINIKYIALFAYKLEFFHPIYKNKLTFTIKPHNYYPFTLKNFVI